MKRKFLSVLLAASMVLTALPATAWAEDGLPETPAVVQTEGDLPEETPSNTSDITAEEGTETDDSTDTTNPDGSEETPDGTDTNPDEDGAEDKVELPAPVIAPLHDTRVDESAAGAIADADLYETNSYTLTSTTGDDGVTTVAITVKGLKEHRNNDNPKAMGHWVGFGLVKPENATGVSYYFDTSKPNESTSLKALSGFESFGDDEGILFYTDASAESPKTWVKVKWTGDESAVLGEMTYEMNLKGVEIFVEDEEEETVALPQPEISVLHDNAAENAIPDEELYDSGSYKVTSKAADGVTEVAVVVTGLKEHENANNAKGYWTGFALAALEGADGLKYKFDTSKAAVDINLADVEVSGLETGVNAGQDKNGIVFFADAFAASPKVWAKVQWTKEGADYGEAMVYHMDLTGVTKYEAPVYKLPEVERALLGNNDAEGVTNVVDDASYKVVGGAEKEGVIPVTITAKGLREHKNAQNTDGYWIGFALAAPDQAGKIKFSFGKTKDAVDTGFSSASASELEPAVNTAGKKGIAFYANADPEKENEVKRFAKVQWLDKKGEVIVIDGKDTFVYEMNLDGVETVADAPVAEPAVEVDESALDALTEDAKEVASASNDAIKAGATKLVPDENLTDAAVEDTAAMEVAGKVTPASQLDALKAATSDDSIQESSVKIVVQPYLDVKVTDATSETKEESDGSTTTEKTLTVQITPKYRIVATTADVENNEEIVLPGAESGTVNAVVVENSAAKLAINESVVVKIPLGDGFAEDDATLYVEHSSDTGTKYGTYEGTVSSNVLTFTNPHGFSIFKVKTTSDEVAKVDGTLYATLAQAVENVTDGGTITLLKDVDNETITISREVSFTISLGDKSLGENVKFLAGSDYELARVDKEDENKVTITVTAKEITGKAATPVITPNGGIFSGSQEVTITCATAGATIYYTTDGSAPTEGSSVYSTPIMLTATTTVKAIAVKDGMTASRIAEAKFTKYSGGGGSSSGGSGGGGTSSSSSTITISSDSSSVKADVKISGGTAVIGKVDKLDKVIGDGVVAIDLTKEKKNIDTVKVDSSIVNAIAKNEDSEGLEIKLSDGTVALDADAVAAVKGGDLTIKLDKANDLNSKQKDTVKDMDVHANYVLTVNGTKALKGGKVDVRIPFAVPSDKDAEGFSLYFVAEDGTTEMVSARFSGDEVRFTADAFGDYVIAYKAAAPAEPAEETPVAADCDGGSSCPAHKFTDVNTSLWYHKAVDYAINNSLMSGVGENTFSPNANLSRAMLAQILYNLAGRPAAAGASDFNDVAEGMWYTNAIAWAAENGVVSGLGNGKFGPNDNITREQLAVMLYRYAGSPAAGGSLDGFADAGRVSGYAQNGLVWATSNGVMSGKGGGMLDPQGLATRAEVAQMLYNYLNK